MKIVYLCIAFLFLMLVVPANAQIINGGFETGDFTGWTAGTFGGPYPQVVTYQVGFTDSMARNVSVGFM